MPPYRVNPPQRVNSLPTMSSEHDLGVLPPVAPVRASCDPCRKRKLRCTGAEPREGGARMCERCFTRGEVCIFSARKPMGRPRTVSSNPPSPSPCLSQPTTPPTPFHHNMRMLHRGGKPHVPRHGFDTMYNQGAEHMGGFHHPEHNMGWVTPAEQGPNGLWLATPPMSTPPLSGPHQNGPMLMAPSASSDSFLGWSDVSGDNDDKKHSSHQRAVSMSNSDFMFEQSSATQVSNSQHPSQFGFNDASPLPNPLRCLCQAGRGIDDLRAQLRDVASGAPAVEIALGAAHSVSNRCMASTTCPQCMGDQSTTIALLATVALVANILQHAVPALQNMTSKSNVPVIGSFVPSSGSSPASLATAIESEVASLRRASSTVITNLRKAMGSNSPSEPSSIDHIMFDQLQQNLAELGSRVASLNSTVETPASATFTPMSWQDAPQQPATPAWDVVVPLTAV